MTLEEKYEKALELLKDCRKHGVHSEFPSFWDRVVNTEKVDKFLKEIEAEE